MSYRIEYDTAVGKYEVQKISPRRFSSFLLVSVLVFLLGMAAFKPAALDKLCSVLIPGEDTVTVAAFQTMTNDLRSGAGIRDAFYDFCRMVMHGR